MITDMDNSTVGSSLEPDSASPTLSKPFSLSQIALDPLYGPPGLRPLSDPRSHLRHLTKHRAGLPPRRPPSRFRGEMEVKRQSIKRLKSESNSNQVKPEDLFHPDDKPVAV